MRVAAGTIVRSNYLAFARVAANSFAEHHPDTPFTVLLIDDGDGRLDPAGESFRVVRLEDLGIRDLRRWLFANDAQSVTVGAKPHLLRHLLAQGHDAALFIDADVLVCGPLDSAAAALRQHAIVLSPHLLAPLAGGSAAERERIILLSGSYNGGILGVADRPEAHRMLDWWEARLRTHCRREVPTGMHFDQRWLDLVPSFFDDVHLLCERGINVAHWNLPEHEDIVGGGDLRLFHFSGYRPEDPAAITHYSSRLTFDDIPSARSLFERYRETLECAGHREAATWPYRYDHFDNGDEITAETRRVYRELGNAATQFGDPFATAGAMSFYHWLRRPNG